MTRRGTDDGFATVWGAVAVVVLLAVAGGLWLFGHVATVRHQVANAADLAALAAAGRIDHGVDRPCETAETVTDRMRVRLADCRVRGPDALVIVESDGAPLLAPFGPVTARARAGPADDHPDDPGGGGTDDSDDAEPIPPGEPTPPDDPTGSAGR